MVAMHWGATSGEGKLSKANGSLMRATPLAVWGRNFTPDQIAYICRADSQLSHPNPVCGDAGAVYCIAIAHLINHPGDNKGAFAAAKGWATSNADKEVLFWIDNAEKNIQIPYSPHGGFVGVAFTHAFRHLVLGTSYLDAITETLLGGGDTDTNACIVGGLIGALHGASTIPPHMTHALQNCDTEAGRPRPDFLHPKYIQSIVDGLWAANASVVIHKN